MKISFTPTTEIANSLLNPPLPASQFLPQWYKDMPSFFGGDDAHGIVPETPITPNTTMKHCAPFLDGLTSGYIWYLPVDLEIKRQNNSFLFLWRTEGDFVTNHTLDQHPGLPSVVDGESFVMKWAFEFRITTPKGYSTLFTHPFNRHDLPFRTFSGVVETDSYIGAVQFPFQLISSQMEKDILIIPKGTPLVQFFPFKREDWKSHRNGFDPEEVRKQKFDFYSNIAKTYKRLFWQKKQYT